jgi:tRNA-splicing ligase RtcB
MRGIRKKVVIGDLLWKEPQPEEPLPQGWDFGTLPALSDKKGWKLATRSMATQGGGNHFEELQKDEDGNLWIMIHSGSRGLGGRVFMHYNQLAKNLNAKYHSKVTKDMYLSFLPEGTEEFEQYLREM